MMTDTITAKMNFLPASLTGGPIRRVDLRAPDGSGRFDATEVSICDARTAPDISVHTSGFELARAPSRISDFYDHEDVMSIYYAECKALARQLTGAHTTFTFDHIIREPGVQYTAGGTDGTQRQTGADRGGGYIGSVHMDYTDSTTWDRYLEMHNQTVPQADRVYALNFWRPLSASADDHPLAVCDARTVRSEDLQESVIYGYGAASYSWHEIGIETFSVSAADRHRWYYYPDMTPDDVLVIKSYDSDGVIGRACPHASFDHPKPRGVPRRSIELRVLCFC